jgi:hypothetical protein
VEFQVQAQKMLFQFIFDDCIEDFRHKLSPFYETGDSVLLHVVFDQIVENDEHCFEVKFAFSRSDRLCNRKNDRFADRIYVFFFMPWEPSELGNSSADCEIEKEAVERFIVEKNDEIPMLRFIFTIKITLVCILKRFGRVEWSCQS